MREINIAGASYKLAPNTAVDQRSINPWRAKIQSGGIEYNDFSQADFEEYHDFRNGIGRNRGVGSDARTQWTQGIDFSAEGQTVLSPLVTTAGSFGVAPVKIIDFDSETYAIGHNLIAKWNDPNANAWNEVSTSLANPIDALVITDGTDEYFIVSSATAAIYSTSGASSSWNELVSWKTPDSHSDPDSAWTNPANAYDDDTSSYTYPDAADKFLELVPTNSILCDSIQIYAIEYPSSNPNVNIDFYYEGAWHDVFDGTITKDTWTTKTNSADGVRLVEKARVESSSGANFRLKDFDFEYKVKGYLADYDNKLYFITTDGQLVGYSASKDIDAQGGAFGLTGNFGTVYDLFEGKLLADGTPTLYFTGTQGLFTIDVSAQKAYKQEVAYPPLTYAGHRGIYWNANVYVATGYGILKVAPSIATFIGPDQDDGLPSGYQGKIYDFATVNNWLVYCVNGGTTDRSSILKRNSSLGGNLQVYTGGVHKVADTSNTTSATDASTQLTLETLLNEIKGDYNTHIASTTYHQAADSTNDVTATNASTLATALTLVNEIKTDYNAHRILSGVHLGIDDENKVISDDATDLTTAITLANEIKADYNIHILSVGGAVACIWHSPSSISGYAPGRLWFGEGTNVKYVMFPDTTSNVKQISTYQYVDDSGYGTLPIFRKLAAISKTALGVAAITKSCTESGSHDETIDLYYGLNGATATTLLGSFATSPRPTTLEFNSGLGTEFYTIQLAIKLTRGTTNTDSPELESLLFYYYATPARINAWIFNIDATGDDGEQIFTAFETIQDTALLVPFYPSGDSGKASYNVKLTQMPSREWWEERGRREGYFQVVCEEIFNG